MPELSPPDQIQRDTALDIQRSFIVQAPAGSGKTSLLTQRFLALLATVENPEEIVAITFTKKAAAEMQTRIIEALQMATLPTPDVAHLKTTYELALKAYQQDQTLKWHLLQNKHRLRILTIDAFCLLLTNKMPLLSKAIPYCRVAEDPADLYRTAAEACLETAFNHPAYQASIKCLLEHLGNNQQQMIDLFILLIQKREQWLKHIFTAQQLEQEDFENVLKNYQQKHCQEINQLLNNVDRENLAELIEYQLAYLPLKKTANLENIDFDEFKTWQHIANLFLSSKNEIKKRFTKKDGFPAGSEFKNKDEKNSAQEIKTKLKMSGETFSDNPQLCQQLTLLKLLPETAYNKNQWHVLQSLLKLLPLLVAELQVIFKQTGKVDFSEISIQALNALGGEDDVTELALYLDYQIKHLLIDEFQDTSQKQHHLLSRLTESWIDGDGKTLFLVGDPMQSIYRFREAEVGIFLDLQKNGINQTHLTPLQLNCNFRSNAGLIETVNQLCHSTFPKFDEIEAGAVSYVASQTINTTFDNEVQGIHTPSKLQEAAFIADYIQQNQDDNIAILVKSRSQLNTLIPYLLKQNISIEGVDLEGLLNNYLITILLAIVKLLAQPNDLLSLSILLVSPLCGINYTVLHKLISLLPTNEPFPVQALLKVVKYEPQDNDLLRAQKLLATFYDAHQKPYRVYPYQNTINIWHRLNGDLIIESKDQDDIEQFWLLLANHQQFPFDINKFEMQLAKRFSNQMQKCNVKVMTIHKSKGLEFDTVFLPSIQYASKEQSAELLTWMEDMHDKSLLLSPIHNAFEDKDPLVNYIRYLDKQKGKYENQRLFYVACTRAKSKLVMINSSEHSKKIPSNSFLEYCQNHIEFETKEYNIQDSKQVINAFCRLPQALFNQNPNNEYVSANDLPKQIKPDPQQIIGTFIHEQLFHFAELNIQVEKFQFNPDYSKQKLLQMGLEYQNLDSGLQTYSKVLQQMQSCPIAKWIFTTHSSANNEYKLHTQTQHHFIIDRTFVENDTRWIVDYKIANNTEQHLEQYTEQLNHYAALFSNLSTLPIKLMLYYPLLKKDITWQHEELISA